MCWFLRCLKHRRYYRHVSCALSLAGPQVTGHASDVSAAAQDAASDAAGRAQKVAGDSYDAAKGSAYDATASGRLAAHETAAQAGSTWAKAKNVVADVVDKVCPFPLCSRLYWFNLK